MWSLILVVWSPIVMWSLILVMWSPILLMWSPILVVWSPIVMWSPILVMWSPILVMWFTWFRKHLAISSGDSLASSKSFRNVLERRDQESEATLWSSTCLSSHGLTHGGSRTQLECFQKSVSLFPSEHRANLDSAFPSCIPVNEVGRGRGGGRKEGESEGGEVRWREE